MRGSLEEKRSKTKSLHYRGSQWSWEDTDSWTIFDNSGDVPKMIAFEESGRIEILDPDLFDILLGFRGKLDYAL